MNKENLTRQYVQFIKSYFDFEKVKLVPAHLHDSEMSDGESDSEEEESTSNDEYDFDDGPNLQDEEFSHTKLPINGCSLSTVLKIMKISGLKSVFPVLCIALQISVTLPVASTTPERTFSKLAIVKNRLRSTMSQGRLEHLMILSCKNIDIDTDHVINKFAKNSSMLEKALLY